MSVLQVEHLKKSFGQVSVLKDISFTLNKGDVLSIIGPSGSGKSTLLRCITQLETIDEGYVSVAGKDLTLKNTKPAKYAPQSVLRKIRLSTGLVFQNFNLFPHQTVLQNVKIGLRLVLKKSREESDKIAYALLEKMGLSSKAKAYPCELSGGQQQRVSIARALAMGPEILFFDEPTSALDPELTGEILKVIQELAKEKRTMVIVTHEMAFARDVATQVIFMDKGFIVEQGSPDFVFKESANERLKTFLSGFSGIR